VKCNSIFDTKFKMTTGYTILIVISLIYEFFFPCRYFEFFVKKSICTSF